MVANAMGSRRGVGDGIVSMVLVQLPDSPDQVCTLPAPRPGAP